MNANAKCERGIESEKNMYETVDKISCACLCCRKLKLIKLK